MPAIQGHARSRVIVRDGDDEPMSSFRMTRDSSCNPFSATVARDRPLLQAKSQQILERLISSYCSQPLENLPPHIRERMEGEIHALQESGPIQVHVLNTADPNACIMLDGFHVFLNLGLFRAALEHPDECANWDFIAGVLGHELGHIPYPRSKDPLEEDAEAHDEENLADSLALQLMDQAGFNPRYANFYWTDEADISTDDFGLLSDHPNAYSRNERLKEKITNSYWRHYSETPTESFSEDEAAEMTAFTPAERMCRSKARGQHPGRESDIYQCLEILSLHLTEVFPMEVRDEFFLREIKQVEIDEVFLPAFSRFCEAAEKQLRKLYNGPRLRTDEDEFMAFCRHRFVAWLSELTIPLHVKQYEPKHNAEDEEPPPDGDIEDDREDADDSPSEEAFWHMRKFMMRYDECRDPPEMREATLRALSDFLDGSTFSRAGSAVLKRVMGLILRLEDATPCEFAGNEIIAFLEELPPLPGISPENVAGPTPYVELFSTFSSALVQIILPYALEEKNGARIREIFPLIQEKLGKEVWTLAPKGACLQPASVPELCNDLELLIRNGSAMIAEDILRTAGPSLVEELLQSDVVLDYTIESSLYPEVCPPGKEIEILSVESLKEICISGRIAGASGDDSDVLEVHDRSGWISCLARSVRHLRAMEQNRLRPAIPAIRRAIDCDGAPSQRECRYNRLADVLYELMIDAPYILAGDWEEYLRLGGRIEGRDGRRDGLTTLGERFQLFMGEATDQQLEALMEAISEPMPVAEEESGTAADLAYMLDGSLEHFAGRVDVKELVSAELLSRYDVSLPTERYALAVSSDGTELCVGYDGKFCLRVETDLFRAPDFSPYQSLTMEQRRSIIRFAGFEDAFIILSSEIEAMKRAGIFDEAAMRNLSRMCPSEPVLSFAPRSKQKIDYAHGTGINFLRLRDLPHLCYLQNGRREELLSRTPAEFLAWLETWWPEGTELRDGLVCQYVDCHPSIANDLALALAFLDVFKDKERGLYLSTDILKHHLESAPDVTAKINIIERALPDPSPVRDSYLTEALESLSFTVSDYERIAPLYSQDSRQYVKKESQAHGTLGAAFSSLDGARKRDLALWLFGKTTEKPEMVRLMEFVTAASMDRLPEGLGIPAIRHEMLHALFASNQGLFDPGNQGYLKEVCEALWGDLLEEDPGRERQVHRRFKRITRAVLQAIMRIPTVERKLAVITAICDVLIERGENARLEHIAGAALSAFGTSAIKATQILSEQRELQESLPYLAEELGRAKDQAPLVPVPEVMEAVLRNGRLRAADPLIGRTLSNASIGNVRDITIDGEEYVVKTQRARASKYLAEEEKDLLFVCSEIEPVLQKELGVSGIPSRFIRRIFKSLEQDLNFAQERANMDVYRELLPKKAVRGITFYVPEYRPEYSDDFTIVERKAPGESFDDYCRTHAEAEVSSLEAAMQRLMLDHIKAGTFHCDLHGKNSKVFSEGSARQVAVLDVVPLGRIDGKEDLDFFTGMFTAEYLPEHSPQTYQRLLRKLLPHEVYSANEEDIAGCTQDLPEMAAKTRWLAVLNLLERLDGYEVPDGLLHLTAAAAKIPYMTLFKRENIPAYIRCFGHKAFGGFLRS